MVRATKCERLRLALPAFAGKSVLTLGTRFGSCEVTALIGEAGIQITDDPARFETYADILTRHDLHELTIEAESAPPGETSSASMLVQTGRSSP